MNARVEEFVRATFDDADAILEMIDRACAKPVPGPVPRRPAKAVLATHVSWNFRLKTTAGRAGWAIELNPRLRGEGPAAVRRTFIHELAHIIAPAGAGHGPAWQAVMRDLGARPERTHNYASMARDRRPVATCERCGFVVRRARPVSDRWLATHFHRGCHGAFRRYDPVIDARPAAPRDPKPVTIPVPETNATPAAAPAYRATDRIPSFRPGTARARAYDAAVAGRPIDADAKYVIAWLLRDGYLTKS